MLRICLMWAINHSIFREYWIHVKLLSKCLLKISGGGKNKPTSRVTAMEIRASAGWLWKWRGGGRGRGKWRSMWTGGGNCWGGGGGGGESAGVDMRSWSEEDKRKKKIGEAWRQPGSNESQCCLTVQPGYPKILFRSATGTLVWGGYCNKTPQAISYSQT